MARTQIKDLSYHNDISGGDYADVAQIQVDGNQIVVELSAGTSDGGIDFHEHRISSYQVDRQRSIIIHYQAQMAGGHWNRLDRFLRITFFID